MSPTDPSHLDYRALLRASKQLDVSTCTTERRIAILSDAAVPQLVPLLRTLFAARGVRAEIHLAEYDTLELEVFDAASALYAFAPDAVVLLHAPQALRLRYWREAADREHFAERTVDGLVALWDTLRARTPALILQSNFPPPYERQFGNFDHLLPHTLLAQSLRLNVLLADAARERSGVLIDDVCGLATRIGLQRWFDERLWTLAKSFCALEHLPLVARNVVDLVQAAQGAIVKCVVTDLDGTLWSGVVGDDGVAGLEMDAFGHAEPHHRLQHYLRELRRRGIVLAVCSKNDHATALDAFRSHPDMVLAEADVAVFVANWGPKPDNLRHIRDTLNIGFDSIVFLDDNAFERALVRDTLPGVIVPELPEDPAEWVRFLSELNLFEATSFSEEDRRRADAYRANAQREEARTSFSDITEYLRSLDMRITMHRFDALSLPRAAQLIQRTNQFSLTARRPSLAECEAMARPGSGFVTFAISLVDRFGDNGLVSIIILRDTGDALDVVNWRMSCRVLARGVEAFAMNRVVETARALGRESITGTFEPTAKNALVRDFFAGFGFEQTGTTADGGTTWRLRVASYEPRTTCIADADPTTTST
ncbi:HAD-IIIC family phosphatase [Candidatus Binatia bacterium]|nr:HAD-IIIC family phosphatase [Candidatus Binatia bacterium]